MQNNGVTRRLKSHGLQRLLVSTMIGSTLMIGCGDDTEQTSPLAPSTVATVPGPDNAATQAHDTAGYTGAATAGSRNAVLDVGTGNDGFGDEPTDWSRNGGSPGANNESEGPSGPTGLDISELPPGITLADGQRMASERNIRMADDGRARKTQWLKSVRLYENPRGLGVTVQPANTRTFYLVEIDWNRVGGGCDTSDCTEETNGGGPNIAQDIRPRSRFTPEAWYWIWARACNDNDNDRSCNAGYRTA